MLGIDRFKGLDSLQNKVDLLQNVRLSRLRNPVDWFQNPFHLSFYVLSIESPSYDSGFVLGKKRWFIRRAFRVLRVHNLKCCVNIANICEWLGNAGITSSMTLPGAFFNDCGNSSIAFSAFQDDDNNAGGKKSCLKCREQIKLWQRTSQYARFMKWPLMPRQT